ncbi:hypothetical protein B0H10DRAFT_2004627 [Mycena sp. CBHHK59/15]|nr:hypothetical protein B0H10DRAFT_2004627 [Mycena sp. CBHHK59/15]
MQYLQREEACQEQNTEHQPRSWDSQDPEQKDVTVERRARAEVHAEWEAENMTKVSVEEWYARWQEDKAQWQREREHVNHRTGALKVT